MRRLALAMIVIAVISVLFGAITGVWNLFLDWPDSLAYFGVVLVFVSPILAIVIGVLVVVGLVLRRAEHRTGGKIS